MVENIKYRYATDVVVKRVMNKLKLGLFGDSYGEDVHQKSAWKSKLKATPCWHDILGANSHALGGTDIQYSFLEFERYHNLYDQVIFILTQPHRMTLVHNDTILKMNDWSSEKQINQWTIKGILGQFKKPIAISNESKWQVVAGFEGEPDVEGESLKSALKEVQQILLTNESFTQRNYLFYKLVIERIKQIRPDVKFLEAFEYPNNQARYVLMDIFDLENKIMNWADPGKSDARIGHFTIETHIILGNLLRKWLRTDEMFFDFDIKEFENINPDQRKYNASLWNSEEEWIKYYNE